MRPYNSLATLVPLLIGLAFAPSVFDTINREAPADEGPKYSVQLMTGAIHPPGVAVPPKSVVMTKKDGKRYRCYLPSEGGAPSAAASGLPPRSSMFARLTLYSAATFGPRAFASLCASSQSPRRAAASTSAADPPPSAEDPPL